MVPLLISVMVAVGSATAAHAANTPFDARGNEADGCHGRSKGWVVWHNRTATVEGKVTGVPLSTSCEYIDSTTAYFEAYAGTTKIDSQTRTLHHDYVGDNFISFDFTIGDPDLVGGINRVKVTVCNAFTNGGWTCGVPVHAYR
jgi:hypothetical protein